MSEARLAANRPDNRRARRLHERTAENRSRSRPSTTYKGFDILYHPDSWEWSFVPEPGGERVYLGAQLSARRAIDRLSVEHGGRDP